ncbi:hypothetical protein COV82_03240 [Candidatus Peregrinibacteria bacterium CG11_big_fil_rev_8_21_14_0_20_46_8]|nr:MAG: hypothetical protein COV82_03240 [Candidatus Peregrinibacteria bacterium CG11_big_fil_rev_8_21_14_0_20_46_8]
MNHFTVLTLIFGLGVLLQSILQILLPAFAQAKKKKRLWVIIKFSIVILVTAGVGLSIYFDESIASQLLHLGLAYPIVLYIGLLTALFHDQLYQRIDEQRILHINIIFLYFIFVTFPIETLWNGKMALVIGASLLVFIQAFHPKPAHIALRSATHLWAMAMIGFLIFFDFVGWLIQQKNAFNIPPLEVFIQGMSFFVLYAYLIFIVVGLRNRPDEFMKKLGKNFSDRQLSPVLALTIIVVESAILALNYILNFVNDHFLIYAFLVLFPMITSLLHKPAQQKT